MAARWDVWGLSQLHRHLIDIQRDDHATCVTAEYITGAGIHIRHAQTLSASANGSIQIEEAVDIPPELEDLPRVGTVFELRPGLELWDGKSSRGRRSVMLKVCLNCSRCYSRSSWRPFARIRISCSRTCSCAISSPC